MLGAGTRRKEGKRGDARDGREEAKRRNGRKLKKVDANPQLCHSLTQALE